MIEPVRGEALCALAKPGEVVIDSAQSDAAKSERTLLIDARRVTERVAFALLAWAIWTYGG